MSAEKEEGERARHGVRGFCRGARASKFGVAPFASAEQAGNGSPVPISGRRTARVAPTSEAAATGPGYERHGPAASGPAVAAAAG